MGLVAGVVPAAPRSLYLIVNITRPSRAYRSPTPPIPPTARPTRLCGNQRGGRLLQIVFGRNSIDGAGITMASSVHFGTNFNNAFWNGSRMTYGERDGNIFIDFTNSTDVIAHELTHGVTQYSLQLSYTGEAGGLNESLSDVFGSMFRQWSANQDVIRPTG